MKEQDCQQLTLYQEDSPVSPSVWLESKKVKGTIVTSGLRCSELSESLRRVGSSVRTYLESCVLPLPTLYRTWSVKAITSQCLILKLRLSALRTEGKESSSSALWRTPDAHADRGAVSAEKYAERAEKGLPLTLNFQVAHGAPDQSKLWPTPRANKTSGSSSEGWGETLEQRVLKMWPTPAARDCKGANSMEHLWRESGNRNHVDQLANAVKLCPTPTRFDATCGDLKGKEFTGENRHAMKLIQAAKLYPTPRAQSAQGPSQAPSRQGSPDLQTVVMPALYPTATTGAGLCGETGNFQRLKELQEAGVISEEERKQMSQGNGGQLNPDWVEWLMGFPVGWTSLQTCQG